MPIKIYIRLALLACTLLVSQNIWAQAGASGRPVKTYSRSIGRSGLLFDMGVYYGQSEATANPVALNQWENTTSIYDLKLGYILENSFYVGAEYVTRSDNQVSIATSSGGGTGLGLGYFTDNGFNIRIFYRLSEAYGNYSGGTGYQADLGYMINMTSNFFMGLAVSIRQTTFTSNSAIVGFNTWARKETYPFLTLGFLFN